MNNPVIAQWTFFLGPAAPVFILQTRSPLHVSRCVTRTPQALEPVGHTRILSSLYVSIPRTTIFHCLNIFQSHCRILFDIFPRGRGVQGGQAGPP